MEFTFYTVSECFLENGLYFRIATIYAIVKESSNILKFSKTLFALSGRIE